MHGIGPGKLGKDAVKVDCKRTLLGVADREIEAKRPTSIADMEWIHYGSCQIQAAVKDFQTLFLGLSWCLAAEQRLKAAPGYISSQNQPEVVTHTQAPLHHLEASQLNGITIPTKP